MPEFWKPGYKIAGRYEIFKVLGGPKKSGMGIIYVVFDQKERSVVALKTFQDKFLRSERAKDTFKREALAWTMLGSHPNIVRAYYVDTIVTRLFIFLEYIAPDYRGRVSLNDYIYSTDIPLRQTINWAVEFCTGMEYAYSKGLMCHGDIKPDNILISTDGILKITDFGLSKIVDEHFSTHEKKGIVGCLPWMSPEHFEDATLIDELSDIYSFGVVLYQMCSGKLPFRGKSIDEYYYMHSTYSVPQIKSPLFPIIKRCVEKKREQRFTSFSKLKYELEAFLDKPKKDNKRLSIQKNHSIEQIRNQGASYHTLREYERALKIYIEILEDSPYDYITWRALGHLLSEMEIREKANMAFECFKNLNKMDILHLKDTIREISSILKVNKES